MIYADKNPIFPKKAKKGGVTLKNFLTLNWTPFAPFLRYPWKVKTISKRIIKGINDVLGFCQKKSC